MNDDEKRQILKECLGRLAPTERLPALSEAPMPRNDFIKAGILPFLPAPTKQNWRFCFMKPVATRPELGNPSFQLCKGTRMKHTPLGWQDLKSAPSKKVDAELLEETAIREGMEELGLQPEAILKLYDLGPASFTSASTGKVKWLWLFAAEMESEDCITYTGEVAFTTASISWLTSEEFSRDGREDFYPIITSAEKLLCEHYGTGS